MMSRCPTSRSYAARRALTLVEVVAATMIVGLMMVAALGALGAATRSGHWAGNRAIGQTLAVDLMAEIVDASYSDPDGDAVFGHENDETASPRSGFDDVDDYHGWDRQPPEFRDGTPIPNRDQWRREVTVELVQPNNPNRLSVDGADQGTKRVHVIVEYGDQVIAEEFSVRTDTE